MLKTRDALPLDPFSLSPISKSHRLLWHPFERAYDLNFFTRMTSDNIKQAEFVMMIGHSVRITPNMVQSANPVTVRQYIPVEIALVSLVLTTL